MDSRLTFSDAIRLRLPSKIASESMVARAPCPSTFVKPLAISAEAEPARLRIACANGCSENFSTAAAVASSLASLTPAAATISTTSGCPRVNVPVLSKTTTVSLVAFSSAAAFLNRMPFVAPSPVPTMMAIGVANPSASGHAITNTVMVRVNANSRG